MNAKTAVMFVMLMQIAPTPSAPTIAPVKYDILEMDLHA